MGLKKGSKQKQQKESFDTGLNHESQLQLERKLGEWEVLKSKLAKLKENLKDQSLTYLYVYEAAQRLNESGLAVKRGVQKAKNESDAHSARIRALLSKLKAHKKRALEAPVAASDVCLPTEVVKLSKQLGKRSDSLCFAGGSLTFGTLLFACGCAPWALPILFLLFFFSCMPQRIWSFCQRKWTFFLIDFCYCANLGAVLYLLLFPSNEQVGTMVYALTDGPLSAALIVWQCAWAFGSADHAISVLIHLFPGLALFAHHNFHAPKGLSEMTTRILSLSASPAEVEFSNPSKLTTLRDKSIWLFAAPMAFYCTWQLSYYIIVQVMFRQFILNNGYDTSYNCLARRAAKANNFLNKLVRQGSVFRRCCVYGLLQLAFTVISLLAFIPIYHSFWLSCLWQVVKIFVSVYYGSQYQCERMPQQYFLTGMKMYVASTTQPKSRAA